jgi:hypothetical protein
MSWRRAAPAGAAVWLVLIAVFPAHVLIDLRDGRADHPRIVFASKPLQCPVRPGQLPRRYGPAGSFVVIFIAGAVFSAPFPVVFAGCSVLILSGLTDDYWAAWRVISSNAASTIISSRRSSRRPGAADRAPPAAQACAGTLLATCFAVSSGCHISQSPYRAVGPLCLCTLPCRCCCGQRCF